MPEVDLLSADTGIEERMAVRSNKTAMLQYDDFTTLSLR
jgi:hypothetical protein